MIRRYKAIVLSKLGTIFYKVGRGFTCNRYFTFGGWVLAISICLNGKALTDFGLLVAQMEESK